MTLPSTAEELKYYLTADLYSYHGKAGLFLFIKEIVFGIGFKYNFWLIAGVPVVASNICGISYMVEDGQTGKLINPDGPLDIAASIIRFSEQGNAHWEQMGQASR